MAIWLTKDSRVIVQGMTGAEGSKHTRRMLRAGTNVVGGVTPGKGGQSVTFDGVDQRGSGDGQALPVFNSVAEAMAATGADVTDLFVAGAHAALNLAREHDCKLALLIDGSPSCGSSFIYDGAFAGRKHVGAGVTAALLRQHGIEVFAGADIDALRTRLSLISRPS